MKSTRPQRGGIRPLKNLLISSCNSLIGMRNRFRRYYGERCARKIRHDAALKTVACKHFRVSYSIIGVRGVYGKVILDRCVLGYYQLSAMCFSWGGDEHES